MFNFLDTNLQPDTVGDVPDDPNAAPFRPHILHSAHEPIPMVLVNRKPRGSTFPIFLGPFPNSGLMKWIDICVWIVILCSAYPWPSR